MKKLLSFVAILIAIAALAGGAIAQQSTAPQSTPPSSTAPSATAPSTMTAPSPAVKAERARGVVTKVDEAMKQVVVKGKKGEMTFVTNNDTKFMQGSKELSFSDLKAKEHVTVSYMKEGDQMVAKSIHVSAKHATKKTMKE